MSSFFDDVSSEETLNADQSLLFPEKDFVKFTVIDCKENKKNGDLILDCQINSGEHDGKRHTIFVSDRDHEIAKKQKAQFLKAFWPLEKLKSGNVSPSDLVTAEFQARAGKARTVDNGMTFQNFSQFQKLNETDATPGSEPTAPPPPTEQAPLTTPEGSIA